MKNFFFFCFFLVLASCNTNKPATNVDVQKFMAAYTTEFINLSTALQWLNEQNKDRTYTLPENI